MQTVSNSLAHSTACAKQDSLETEKPALVSRTRNLHQRVFKCLFMVLAVKYHTASQERIGRVLASFFQLKLFSLHIMNKLNDLILI